MTPLTAIRVCNIFVGVIIALTMVAVALNVWKGLLLSQTDTTLARLQQWATRGDDIHENVLAELKGCAAICLFQRDHHWLLYHARKNNWDDVLQWVKTEFEPSLYNQPCWGDIAVACYGGPQWEFFLRQASAT
jgi:hypothetical protein